jgi:ferric iron reductase protein FhuF
MLERWSLSPTGSTRAHLGYQQTVPDMRELQGGEARLALRTAFDRVQSLVPYLRAEVGRVTCATPGSVALENEVEDGVWIACSDLIDHPEWLLMTVRASGLAIGTSDPMVAASILVQGYAYRLLALPVASLVASDVLPDSTPASVAIRLSKGRPSHIAYRYPTAQRLEKGWGPGGDADSALGHLIGQTIEAHLRPLIASVRSVVQVGERMLWGNVAASASTAFRTMEGCLGRWVIPVGVRFFELAPSELHHQGSFLLMERGQRHGWFWERTNCCLHDRLPGDIRCSDCSRTSAQERRAAYWASLET